MLRMTTILLLLATAHSAVAATLRVPEDHKTIQAAIDASQRPDVGVLSEAFDEMKLRRGALAATAAFVIAKAIG